MAAPNLERRAGVNVVSTEKLQSKSLSEAVRERLLQLIAIREF